MKRILAILGIGILLMTTSVGLAEQPWTGITVASTTAMRGAFFGELFGGTTADLEVRALLHGAETVRVTASAVDSLMYQFNTDAMAGVSSAETALGTEYTFTLRDGLKWSDGSPLTARDYVFSVLMQSSPALEPLGAYLDTYDRLVGWEAYASGASDTFSGVRLLDDRRFCLTIDKAYLPDFFELADVCVFPCPAAVCAPQCEVTDTGAGAALAGAWTAETVTNYVAHPALVSGPYRLDSFDAEQGIAQFSANPYYCGKAPNIASLRFVTVSNGEIAARMAEGTVDVFVAGTDMETIRSLNALNLNRAEHDRRGLAFLALNCAEGPCTDVNVRKAIACCIDRDQLIRDFLGGRGQRVNGWYGIGQWMIPDTAMLLEQLTSYNANASRAASFLRNSRYTLDENGAAYAGTGIRYAQGPNGLEKLALTYFRTMDNRCAALIGDMLTAYGQRLGFEVEIRDADMRTEAEQYYRTAEREYDVMFLATNFRMVYDPADEFSLTDEAQGYQNKSGLRDEKLYSLALAMRATPAGRRVEYLEKFMAFQTYFSQVLPSVPLYSNRYTTYWNSRVANFYPDRAENWPEAILTAVQTGR